MKLNAKCIRDIMLYLEGNLTYDDELNILSSNLGYSNDELEYTCIKLQEANLIKVRKNVIGELEIQDITIQGHQFLSKIKDNKLWNKVLSKLSSLAEPITITLLERLITEFPIVS